MTKAKAVWQRAAEAAYRSLQQERTDDLQAALKFRPGQTNCWFVVWEIRELDSTISLIVESRKKYDRCRPVLGRSA